MTYLTLLTRQYLFNMETLSSTETVATGADAGNSGKKTTKNTTAGNNGVAVCG